MESLSKKKEKLLELVNSVFNALNENNIATTFVKVLQKKTTENAIFNEKKLEFDEKFKLLEALSDEIKLLKTQIVEKLEQFNKLKQNASKLGEENDKVKNFLLYKH